MLTRKTVILAKIEAEYGTDPVPTAAANAILVKDVSLRPIGPAVTRDFYRSVLSPLEFVRGIKGYELSFVTELKGTGTIGALPSFGWEGPLARACGMAESVDAGVKIEWDPVSTGFESCTIYVYMDGIFHKLTGCRGSFVIRGTVGEYMEIAWTFQGLWNAPADASPSAQTFSSVTPPRLLSATLTLNSVSLTATAVEIALNNAMGRRLDMNDANGLEEVLVTGREPGGSLDPETVLEATNPLWAIWTAATAYALNIGVIGSVSGNRVQITAPKLQIDEGLAYGDREGLLAYEMPFKLAQSSGDDELKVTFT